MKLREIERKGGKSYFIDFRENGQRRRIRLEGITDRETAELAFADFRLRRERGKIGLPTDRGLKLRDALEAHLEAKQAEGGHAGHLKTLEARIRQAQKQFGDVAVADLSERAVAEWRALLVKAKNSPPTVNKKIELVQAAIERAIREGRIASNPIAHLQRLSDARPEKWRWLREDEAAALLGVLRDGVEVEIAPGNRKPYKQTLGKNPDLYALVLFLLCTGARRGEALGLTWGQVDLRRGTVALHTGKSASKGRRLKVRHVPLNPALKELLEGMPRGATGERVFGVSLNNLKRVFKRTCELAGLGHVRIHDLRHTCASHLVLAGTPLNTVRELLGHTSMTMTLRYAHLAPEATAKAVETLPFGGRDGARILAVGGA